MLYLKEKDILKLHDYILDATGGMPGIRMPTALGAIVFDISATLHYEPETPWKPADIAALYVDKIAKGHPFNDGNKRTAFASAIAFLRLNGYDIDATSDQLQSLAQVVVELVLHRVTWEEFSAHLGKFMFKSL